MSNSRKSPPNYKQTLTKIYNALFKAFGPQHWWPGDTPFEIAIGAILTQNTNWGNVEKAIGNLKKQKALSANAMHKIQEKQLALLIKPAGYFNVKAKRLKGFLDFLTNHYSGSMKRMKAENKRSLRKRLLDINGVGPETADSILLYALEKPVFVIDAYTKRVLQRHKFVSDNAAYHEIQALFHNNLPKDTGLFNEFHALFVRLAKDYCRTKPRCKGCPVEGIQDS